MIGKNPVTITESRLFSHYHSTIPFRHVHEGRIPLHIFCLVLMLSAISLLLPKAYEETCKPISVSTGSHRILKDITNPSKGSAFDTGIMKHITIDPTHSGPPTKESTYVPVEGPEAKETKVHPTNANGDENASLFFIGTATTILEWEGLRVLTDPNFLHAGDHVHLGPGVTGTRQTNPAINLEELPRIDAVLLSHYHADHFDQEVEARLTKSIPIITTPHAHSCLTGKGDQSFTQVHALDHWESLVMDISTTKVLGGRKPAVKVSGMPGKHVPPGPLAVANDLLGAVPPTNGWMLELGYQSSENKENFESGYRIYISGDTLMVDELKKIPERYAGQNIDLMLIHLGGTTIPGPKVPLLMVTMDAKQGVQLMQLINPDLTIPIHYDDYDVFMSPLEDFKRAVEEAGWKDKMVYLDRKDAYKFKVDSQLKATRV